jgi:hypothetical protein
MTLRVSENELHSKSLEVLDPNLGWDTGHPEVFRGFPMSLGKIPGQYLDQAMTISF